MSTQPDDWPQDCPPSTAIDANGVYFHLLKHDPPSPPDLLTYKEQGKGNQCTHRALSVFVSKRQILHFRDLLPQLGDHVAELALEPSHGKIKVPTRRDGHTEWWPTQGLDRKSVIKKIVQCPHND